MKDDKKETDIDIRSAYEEGCSTLRHYSTAVRNVRAIAIAQGFVVLSGVALLTKEDHPLLAIIGAIFGVVLTVILSVLHENYHGNVMVTAQHLVAMENKYFSKKLSLWSKLDEVRRKRFSNGPYSFFLNRAVYHLIVVAMAILIISNIVASET